MNSYRHRSHKLLLYSSALVLCCASFSIAQNANTAARPAAKNPAEAAASGKEVYRQRCASCHFNESAAQKIGPGLKGIYARGTFADGRKVDDASLARWINSGGKDMPAFKEVLKLEQVRDLISYLRTL